MIKLSQQSKQNLTTAGIGLGAGLLGNVLGSHLGIDHHDIQHAANDAQQTANTAQSHPTSISAALKNAAENIKQSNYNPSSDGYGMPEIPKSSHPTTIENQHSTQTQSIQTQHPTTQQAQIEKDIPNKNIEQQPQSTDLLSRLSSLNQQYNQLESQEQQIQLQINSLKNYIQSVLSGQMPAGTHYQNALQQLKELEAKYNQIEFQKESLENQINDIKNNIESQMDSLSDKSSKALKTALYTTLGIGGLAGLAASGYALNNKFGSASRSPRSNLVSSLNGTKRTPTIKVSRSYSGLSTTLKNLHTMRKTKTSS